MPDGRAARETLWIVQGADVVSGRLARALVDTDITHVERISADALVMSMTEARAERLRTEFPDLIVEVNSDLEPLR
ncbi:MAG: hypothetical protein V4617_05290 [Gemmatimonadota bacterium]